LATIKAEKKLVETDPLGPKKLNSTFHTHPNDNEERKNKRKTSKCEYEQKRWYSPFILGEKKGKKNGWMIPLNLREKMA